MWRAIRRKFWLVVFSAVCLTLRAQPATQAPSFYVDKTRLLVYLDETGKEHPIDSPAGWLKRREHILANLQLVMGKMPERKHLPPLELQVLHTTAQPGYELREVTFASEPGDRMHGYLLVPTAARRRPAVLCLHQTAPRGSAEPAGLSGRASMHCAAELAQRGYVTLAVDYPNFGDYQFNSYEHGYASATMKGIWNHRRALDLLESLAEVDAARLGVVGHSLGGHNSLFVAAFDERIKCVVTSCGFCSFARYYGGDLTGWSHAGYMPRIADLYERDPAKMPFDFTEVLGVLAPRPVLIVAPLRDANFDVEGVRDCVRAAMPVYELLGHPEHLRALYPDAEHDFPAAERETACVWFDRYLNGGRPPTQASP